MRNCRMQKEAEITHYNSESFDDTDSNIRDFLDFVKVKRLETPVIFLLELYRPLVLIGDSLITVFNPFLTALSIPQKFIKLFKDRKTVENLIEQLQKNINS